MELVKFSGFKIKLN